MRSFVLALIALTLSIGLVTGSEVFAAVTNVTLVPGDSINIVGCTTKLRADLPVVECIPAKTPTATSTPTPTPGPVNSGWHAPGTHAGVTNGHEHGDAPPAWVLASANQPFTQTRESHTGYKGYYFPQAVNGANVQMYLITHILATNMARSHGDHDFQLWWRAPSGNVYYYAGLLQFNDTNILLPIPTRTSDDGTRPVVLAEGDGGCETWYGTGKVGSASVGGIGNTICGRYEKFTGLPTGLIGTHRGIDWVTLKEQLPTELQQYATVEFTVERLSWLQPGHELANGGVSPIN